MALSTRATIARAAQDVVPRTQLGVQHLEGSLHQRTAFADLGLPGLGQGERRRAAVVLRSWTWTRVPRRHRGEVAREGRRADAERLAELSSGCADPARAGCRRRRGYAVTPAPASVASRERSRGAGRRRTGPGRRSRRVGRRRPLGASPAASGRSSGPANHFELEVYGTSPMSVRGRKIARTRTCRAAWTDAQAFAAVEVGQQELLEDPSCTRFSSSDVSATPALNSPAAPAHASVKLRLHLVDPQPAEVQRRPSSSPRSAVWPREPPPGRRPGAGATARAPVPATSRPGLPRARHPQTLSSAAATTSRSRPSSPGRRVTSAGPCRCSRVKTASRSSSASALSWTHVLEHDVADAVHPHLVHVDLPPSTSAGPPA